MKPPTLPGRGHDLGLWIGLFSITAGFALSAAVFIKVCLQ